MLHAFPCPDIYISNVFTDDNTRKLQQHCQLFQVCEAFPLPSPILFLTLFINGNAFCNPDYFPENRCCNKKKEKKRKKVLASWQGYEV